MNNYFIPIGIDHSYIIYNRFTKQNYFNSTFNLYYKYKLNNKNLEFFLKKEKNI
jgi:hypothetical protein